MEIKKTQEVVPFYNLYVDRQKKVGVNQRHRSIMSKVIDLGLKPNHNVLEVGCGIGTQTQLLIKYLSKGTLLSGDISDKSIAIAKERLGKYKNLQLEVIDATDFHTEHSFDAIILPDVIEHIPVAFHAQMFGNLSKMLKADGFIYIHIPNPYYLSWCHKYRQEVLQVIDQPIYLEDMLKNIEHTGLYLFYEKSYTIWTAGRDYTHRVLRKKPDLASSVTYTSASSNKSFWNKFVRLACKTLYMWVKKLHQKLNKA